LGLGQGTPSVNASSLKIRYFDPSYAAHKAGKASLSGLEGDLDRTAGKPRQKPSVGL
jgi:hypothetical protein